MPSSLLSSADTPPVHRRCLGRADEGHGRGSAADLERRELFLLGLAEKEVAPRETWGATTACEAGSRNKDQLIDLSDSTELSWPR